MPPETVEAIIGAALLDYTSQLLCQEDLPALLDGDPVKVISFLVGTFMDGHGMQRAREYPTGKWAQMLQDARRTNS